MPKKATAEAVPEPEVPATGKVFNPKYRTFETVIRLTKRMYGGIPQNPEILRRWIEAKGEIPEESLADKIAAMTPEDADEAVDEKVEMSSTAFRSDSEGMYVCDFMLKQMLKESATAVGLTVKKRGSKTALTIALVVEPYRIRPERDGKALPAIDGFEEFQGRIRGPQGPRSILTRKAYLEVGTEFRFQITFLDGGTISADDIRLLLDHAGRFVGFGSARSRESGKFEVVRFVEI